jgi:hypothetical protein
VFPKEKVASLQQNINIAKVGWMFTHTLSVERQDHELFQATSLVLVLVLVLALMAF